MIADVLGALCLPAGASRGCLASWSVLHKDSGLPAAESSGRGREGVGGRSGGGGGDSIRL